MSQTTSTTEGEPRQAENCKPQAGGARRRSPLVKWMLLCLLIAVGTMIYFLQRRGPSFDGWSENLQAAIEQARKEQRPVLVYFMNSDSDDEVTRMLKTTLAQPANKTAVEETRLIRVRVKTSLGSEMANRYNLKRLPTMLVLDSAGVECKRAEDFIGEVPFRANFLEPAYKGWEDDAKSAINSGKANKQPVLVLFLMDSNGASRRLGLTTLTSESAENAMQAGRCIKVLARIASTKHPLAVEYNITRFPTLLLIQPDGSTDKREGYLTQEEFRKFLTDAAATTAPSAIGIAG